jgi:hypothetical protein
MTDFGKFMEKWMTRKRRIRVSLATGAALLFVLYSPYVFGGYMRWAAFPLVSFFTDIPDCPRCDHLAVHSPLLEWLLISVLIYWGCLGIAKWQRKRRLQVYLAQQK